MKASTSKFLGYMPAAQPRELTLTERSQKGIQSIPMPVQCFEHAFSRLPGGFLKGSS